ncbi:MAG: DUF881 domain-containing protein [Clostridia bacterium]|nr:DUF881 domain-containing protein [Clostridia bacterium]
MDNKKVISIILGVMCVLLTCGIAIQIRTTNNAGTMQSTNTAENKLRDAVLKSKEQYDNIYNELEAAEKRLEKERADVTQNNGELAELENKIKENKKAVGLAEVKGQGIIVTLNDNQKISSSSYIGDPNDLLIHYSDVVRVVNELKNAGAEAISVNEQRIVTTSSIECDGTVIKINGVKIGTPIEIKAIGFQEMLINIDRQGGYLRLLREKYGLVANAEKKDEITIPKYSGLIKFNYAVTK